MPEAARIVELVDRLGRIAHSLQFSGGLNPAQWSALRYLSRANRHSVSPGALAAFMNCTRGTVSQTLTTLEQRGLIEKRRRTEDRRAVELALTPFGREILEQDPLVSVSEAVLPCSEDERASFVSHLERLVDAVQARHGLAEFGPCPDCRYLADEGSGFGHRCGVTGEMIGAADLGGICAHFERAR